MKLKQTYLTLLLLCTTLSSSIVHAAWFSDQQLNNPSKSKPSVIHQYDNLILTQELHLAKLSDAEIARIANVVIKSFNNYTISKIAQAFTQGISNSEAKRLGHALVDGISDKDAQRLGLAFAQGINKHLDDNKIMESVTNKFDSEVAPYLKSLFQSFVGAFINFENAIRFGTPIAFGIAIPLAGFYGSRVLWKVAEKHFINPKPQILLPGSKYGYWDRIKRKQEKYVSPAMIFDQQVKDRLLEIQQKTKNIKNLALDGKNITYDNLLLHGKPGTGKTMFVQALSDTTDMDLLIVTAASLLQSGIEGIKYFDELIEMANNSKYGVIIFVDEADALFLDRNTLNPSSDEYKVLNHILAITGSGSKKFMLIAATNHTSLLDDAMGRRFQDRVCMPLPNAQTREDLIELYLNSIIFNTAHNSISFVSAAQELFTTDLVNQMICKTERLSHAEIKDMIDAIRKKAITTDRGTITEKIIEDAIKQAMEKVLAAQQDKENRKNKL